MTLRQAQGLEGPLVLGIETSCDETGVGIVRGTTLLADAVASSMDEHAAFGGVVPEVASRAHLEAMVPTIEQACLDAGVQLRDIDAVAVTAAPVASSRGARRGARLERLLRRICTVQPPKASGCMPRTPGSTA